MRDNMSNDTKNLSCIMFTRSYCELVQIHNQTDIQKRVKLKFFSFLHLELETTMMTFFLFKRVFHLKINFSNLDSKFCSICPRDLDLKKYKMHFKLLFDMRRIVDILNHFGYFLMAYCWHGRIHLNFVYFTLKFWIWNPNSNSSFNILKFDQNRASNFINYSLFGQPNDIIFSQEMWTFVFIWLFYILSSY